MLFTLRLLPATKIWQARVVVAAWFLNLAITIFAVIVFGIQCVPFRAIYEPVAHPWCESQNVAIIATKVNGILACIIDITTALVPVFLLWSTRIRRKTKFVLDMIFLLGLVTAGLSIGRALTFHTDTFKRDTSWRLISPSFFSLIEEKCGIIFACCPAVRQLIAHISRTGTALPTRRHSSDEDFKKSRTKVVLRDVFWNRKPSANFATLSGAPLCPPEEALDENLRAEAEKRGRKSTLDRLDLVMKPRAGKRSFWPFRSKDPCLPTRSSHPTAHHRPQGSYPQAWPGASDSPERRRIASRYRAWDWPWSTADSSTMPSSKVSSSLAHKGSHESDSDYASPHQPFAARSPNVDPSLARSLSPQAEISTVPPSHTSRSMTELTNRISGINPASSERPITLLSTHWREPDSGEQSPSTSLSRMPRVENQPEDGIVKRVSVTMGRDDRNNQSMSPFTQSRARGEPKAEGC